MMSVKVVLVFAFSVGWFLPCVADGDFLSTEQSAHEMIKNMSSDQRNQLIKLLDSEHAFTGEASFLQILTLMAVVIGGSQLVFWVVKESTKELDYSDESNSRKSARD